MSNSKIANADKDILIVEDNEMLNKVMMLQVKAAGYSVRSARTGAQALKLIAERVPSLIILDVVLSDMNGIDLTAELRLSRSTCSLPLIVHTSLDLSPKEQKELELGPSRFVTKSTAFSDRLAEVVALLLDAGENL